MGQHIIISGCSGGGKSTLLETLRQRGEMVVDEPGRRIVREALAIGDETSLPWIDAAQFARRAIALSLQDLRAVAGRSERIFFDRGLIDAALALEHVTGEPAEAVLSGQAPFHRTVFLAPPWPDIYARDDQRPHGFDEAVGEYERLASAYPRLGYEIVPLPKASVDDRVNFVISSLSDARQSEAPSHNNIRSP